MLFLKEGIKHEQRPVNNMSQEKLPKDTEARFRQLLPHVLKKKKKIKNNMSQITRKISNKNKSSKPLL